MKPSAKIACLYFALGLIVWAGCGTLNPGTNTSSHNITGVFVNVADIHHAVKSNGDTWDHIWAKDDSLYSFGCDGRGFGTAGRNFNFNQLMGTNWDALDGSLVNSMDDYGKPGQRIANGSNWKVTGADCIDGVFYAFIADNWYGSDHAYGGAALDPNLRQTVNNISLIKSTDKGLTWSRGVKANVEQPMWTNKMFSTGFFFKYGQNGGSTKQDDQDKYVYAISNDGYWNCGSAFYLGRVLRTKMGDLNANDWQYLCNGQWTNELAKATPVPGFPTGQMKCTMGSPLWLASLRKYVTVTWFDPGTTTKWYFPEDVTFAFYQADHPWGPWSFVGQKSVCEFMGDTKQRISRWYGPSLSPKFITSHPDGSATVILLFSGQLWDDKPESLYKMNFCPVTFYTHPLPQLREMVNNTAADYSAGWQYQTKRGYDDYQDDIHVTTTPGAYCEFSFSGEGIEILSEKYSDMGDVELMLDGNSQGIFHLSQDPMPRLYQIPFYRKMDLTPGKHSVRVVNRANNGAFCIVDGFKVYGK
jgi:hypothetical protein